MAGVKKLITNQRGVILAIALLIMALLVGAGVGAIVSMQTDFRTSGNLKTGAQAFDIADAGIEWAKQKAQTVANNPPNPCTGNVTSCEFTENFSQGSFKVTFSDWSTESKLIGVVKVTSEGTVTNTNSKATIITLLRKTYQLSDGAISMRGETNASFTGAGFLVDGKDYNTNGTLVPNAKKQFGISTAESDTSDTTTVIKNALDNNQEPLVQGKGTVPDVQESPFLTSLEMSELADSLCNKTYEDISASGYTTGQGKTTWGTSSNPIVKCLAGNGDGDAVTIEAKGSLNGAGILVIKDANIALSGDLDWQGLIIVTGTNVGFKVNGGGSGNIYGSIMINETGSDSPSGKGAGTTGYELDIQGNVNVRYSSSALKNAMNASGLTSSVLSALYDDLPSTISSTYWRMVLN